MQRRNVDLPEPDGPSRQNTSFGASSRSMPLSTSTCPNDLWTFSAFTIAPLFIAVLRSLSARTQIRPDPLQDGGPGGRTGRPAGEPALNVRLRVRQHRGEDEVPD